MHSAVNDPNDYRGPGTGYLLEGERWALLQALPHEVDPATVGLVDVADGPELLRDLGASRARRARPTRSSSRSGPAFGDALRETIGGIPHGDVLRQICAGIEEEGVRYRVDPHRRAPPTSRSSPTTARSWPAPASRSACSRRARRSSTAPTCSRSTTSSCSAWRRCCRLESYRQIGRNAARYANGGRASPVPLVLDNFARAKLIVRTTLLHRRETEAIEPGAAAMDVTLR